MPLDSLQPYANSQPISLGGNECPGSDSVRHCHAFNIYPNPDARIIAFVSFNYLTPVFGTAFAFNTRAVHQLSRNKGDPRWK
jgi:hypothetical protein